MIAKTPLPAVKYCPVDRCVLTRAATLTLVPVLVVVDDDVDLRRNGTTIVVKDFQVLNDDEDENDDEKQGEDITIQV